MLLVSKLNYRGDWYLLRAKFTSDSNFFVREVGRWSGVLERSVEVLQGGGRRWWRQEAGLHIFWKTVLENLSLVLKLVWSTPCWTGEWGAQVSYMEPSEIAWSQNLIFLEKFDAKNDAQNLRKKFEICSFSRRCCSVEVRVSECWWIHACRRCEIQHGDSANWSARLLHGPWTRVTYSWTHVQVYGQWNSCRLRHKWVVLQVSDAWPPCTLHLTDYTRPG